MSKKFEYMKNVAFYSEQKPELLAKVLSGLVSDVATSVVIEGKTSINIPESSSVTEDYTAKLFSQFGDVMDSTSMTWAVVATGTGVSILNGTLTVESTATDTEVTITATKSGKQGSIKVTLVPAND